MDYSQTSRQGYDRFQQYWFFPGKILEFWIGGCLWEVSHMEVRLYLYYELLINYTYKGKEMASEKLTPLGET